MRVHITKDYVDGARSQSITTDLDGMPMSEMVFMLMEPGVCGMTITRVMQLGKIIRELEKQDMPV